MTTRKFICNKALICDLDETLISSSIGYDDQRLFSGNIPPALHERYYSFEISGTRFWGLLRPYALDFLSFARSYFRILGIWTAGSAEYAEAIAKMLTEKINRYYPSPTYFGFDFIYNREHIHYDMVTRGLRPDKDTWVKNLEFIYQMPEVKKLFPDMGKTNTWILDDRVDVCRENPLNQIIIPGYRLGPDDPKYITLTHCRQDDNCLLILKEWLNKPKSKALTELNVYFIPTNEIFRYANKMASNPQLGLPLLNIGTDTKINNKLSFRDNGKEKSGPPLSPRTSAIQQAEVKLKMQTVPVPDPLEDLRSYDRNHVPVYIGDHVSAYDSNLKIYVRNCIVMGLSSSKIMIKNSLYNVTMAMESKDINFDLPSYGISIDKGGYLLENNAMVQSGSHTYIVKGSGYDEHGQNFVIVQHEGKYIVVSGLTLNRKLS